MEFGIDEVQVEGHPVRFEWAQGGEVPAFLGAYGPKASSV